MCKELFCHDQTEHKEIGRHGATQNNSGIPVRKLQRFLKPTLFNGTLKLQTKESE